MRKALFIIAFFSSVLISYAGINPKDSLLNVLKTAKGDQRADALNKLIKQIYKDELPQAKQYLSEAEKLSANYPKGKVGVLINKGRIALFETKDPQKALVYYTEGLKLAESLNFIDGLKVLYTNVGNSYRDMGNIAEAERTFNAGLAKAEELKSTAMKAQFLNNYGVVEYYKGNLDGAIDYFKRSIAEYEKINEKGDVAGITMNVGVILYRTGKNKESLEYYEKALKVLKEVKDTVATADAITNIALTLNTLGNSEEAIKRLKEAEKLYIAKKDSTGLSGCYDNFGTFYSNFGKDDIALKYFLNALKIKERENNLRSMFISYTNIGNVYETLRDTAKTIENYTKALEISKKMGDDYRYAHALRSLASVYGGKKQNKEAEAMLKEAIEITKRINDLPGLGANYISLGNLYGRQHDGASALKYYLMALEIKEKTGEKVSIAGLLSNIGVIYYEKKQFREALKYYDRALKMRLEMKNLDGISESYLTLANLYKETGDFRNAYHYQVKYHKTWDSLYNVNLSSQMMEMNTKYETAKKDQEILKRTAGEKEAKALAEKEALETKNANQRVVFLAIGLLLVLVLAGFTYRANLQRKKANEMLAKTNTLLAESNNEITTQKHLVEEKQKEIIDSISYAKRLQDAIMPPMALIKKHFPESFVLYQPKDIVAGDFYWMETTNDTVLIAAADCTGHGVPGAMVSVVCSNALNRATKEFNISDPGKILDKVRELVVETFDKSESDVKDGMDISLCAVKLKKGGGAELKWAGAYNPLWFIQENEMKKITANKQAVGKTDKPEPFATHNVSLNKGDILYLFTDGFADQFGGPAGKKFKTKKMEELFVQTVSDNMENQAEQIRSEFKSWKGHLEQIDDVCVIGIRV